MIENDSAVIDRKIAFQNRLSNTDSAISIDFQDPSEYCKIQQNRNPETVDKGVGPDHIQTLGNEDIMTCIGEMYNMIEYLRLGFECAKVKTAIIQEESSDFTGESSLAMVSKDSDHLQISKGEKAHIDSEITEIMEELRVLWVESKLRSDLTGDQIRNEYDFVQEYRKELLKLPYKAIVAFSDDDCDRIVNNYHVSSDFDYLPRAPEEPQHEAAIFSIVDVCFQLDCIFRPVLEMDFGEVSWSGNENMIEKDTTPFSQAKNYVRDESKSDFLVAEVARIIADSESMITDLRYMWEDAKLCADFDKLTTDHQSPSHRELFIKQWNDEFVSAWNLELSRNMQSEPNPESDPSNSVSVGQQDQKSNSTKLDKMARKLSKKLKRIPRKFSKFGKKISKALGFS